MNMCENLPVSHGIFINVNRETAKKSWSSGLDLRTACVDGCSTLERFNQGAPKVKAMCGITQQALYKGRFMFALKDTQASNADEVVREFGHKTETLLQEADNFLSTMYPAGVTIAAFPFLEDGAFYDALSEVQGILELFEPQFSNASQFASMSKTLIAKIAHKVNAHSTAIHFMTCQTPASRFLPPASMPNAFHLKCNKKYVMYGLRERRHDDECKCESLSRGHPVLGKDCPV